MVFDVDVHILILLISFGFLAAFIDSVVGGGGLISLPALLFVGLNPAAAVATNKLAGAMGSHRPFPFTVLVSLKFDLS